MNSLKTSPRHFDLSKTLPEQRDFDVIIVGSGAGGGFAADILANAGLSVVLIEEGPLKTQDDFKMLESQAYPELYQESAARRTKDKGITILQGRSVGGSTTVNWSSSFRTPDQTLNFWKDKFGVTGLEPEKLKPLFQSIEKRLNIAPWAVPPNENNLMLQRGAEALGWSFNTIPRNVLGCANLGYCGMGCPLNAKQSMLVTTIPAAMEAGATLISRARCETVVYKNNKATGVRVSSLSSNGHQIKETVELSARTVILSAGAMGTPAIMLRSQLPDPFRRIGKRTMLHPVTATIADYSQPIDAYAGAPQSIYSDHFLWRDGVDGEIGFKLEVPPIHPVLGSTLVGMYGEKHAAIMSRFKHLQSNIALMRDGFNSESLGGEVSLDDNDLPILDYPITDYLWRGARESLLRSVEAQFASGATRVLPLHLDAKPYQSWDEAKKSIDALPTKPVRWSLFSAHVMGGASLGASPIDSVCDSNGRHHQMDNLYVMDGSLFPTSLGVNPQLTIYAMVSKLAKQLATRLVS